MYLIGLTGGIATGKSTVSAILKGYGAIIIDADLIAHQIVEPNTPVWQLIVDYLGAQIRLSDDKIDRRVLGDLVFKDNNLRRWLESVTHPAIKDEIKRQIKAAEESGVQIVILDVPLLIEAGWQNMVDELWLIYVDEPTQLNRLMHRNNLTHEQALNRIQAQMSLEVKKNYAQVLIDNSGTLEQTAIQVSAAWHSAKHKAHL